MDYIERLMIGVIQIKNNELMEIDVKYINIGYRRY
jgi:hypothetical protein